MEGLFRCHITLTAVYSVHYGQAGGSDRGVDFVEWRECEFPEESVVFSLTVFVIVIEPNLRRK